MNKTTIGFNAGKLWELLSNNTRWSYEDLKKTSEMNDLEFNTAIGWLAREDKIDFEGEEDNLNVFLCVNVYIG